MAIVNHVGLCVTDLDRSRTFYEQVFGFAHHEARVRRVVDHSVDAGIKRFATFSPQTPYGEQMARTLEAHVAPARALCGTLP